MKTLQGIGRVVITVVAWIIVVAITDYLINYLLDWLVTAFNVETTLGNVLFFLFTQPEIFYIHMIVSSWIGTFFLKTKKQGLCALILIILTVIALIYYTPTLTSWVTGIATVIAFWGVFSGLPEPEPEPEILDENGEPLKEYVVKKSSVPIIIIIVLIFTNALTGYLFYKAKTEQATIDKMYLDEFGSFNNPATGEQITGAKSYIEAFIEQESRPIYVLNTDKLLYHLEDCPYVKKIPEKDKETVHATVEELTENGYRPCTYCLGDN